MFLDLFLCFPQPAVDLIENLFPCRSITFGLSLLTDRCRCLKFFFIFQHIRVFSKVLQMVILIHFHSADFQWALNDQNFNNKVSHKKFWGHLIKKNIIHSVSACHFLNDTPFSL